MAAVERIAAQTRAGRLKPSETVGAALAKIKACEPLNIFTEVLAGQAAARAADIEDRLARGEAVGKLAGVTFCVKDNFLYEGTKTTAAAPFLADFTAPYTSTCLRRLLDEDAILLGKTNLDAFAHGTSTENSCFGPTANPADPAFAPGGSSGGSAAAVAAGICPFALGTDTGGSVRLPASFCGVFGFKPTYGLLSRYGIVAMASSTDCVAPLAAAPADAGYLTDIMRGADPLDGTTFDAAPAPALEWPPRVGIVKEFRAGLQPEVSRAFEAVLERIETAGWGVEEVSLPDIGLALACYYVLVSAEISSNLSRYDGLRYGARAGSGDWSAVAAASRRSGFMAENKRRIMLGTYVLSQGYYEAYYQRAQKLRTLLIGQFEAAFGRVDALLSPVSPTTAFKLGEKTADPLQMYMADLMTVAASLAGIPASSLPLPVAGMPVGLQIMTAQKTDGLNLKLAEEVGRLP